MSIELITGVVLLILGIFIMYENRRMLKNDEFEPLQIVAPLITLTGLLIIFIITVFHR